MSEELKAAQARIACLEGEIAKRDARVVELDDLVLSLQCKVIERDGELSAIKAQEPVARLPACPSRAFAVANLRDLAQSVLQHDPDVGMFRDEDQAYLINELADLAEAFNGDVKLYAVPVSEAKAQGVVMPERWNVPRPMWKDARQPYGNPLNHADIEAAEKFNLALDEVARLNAAPVQHVSVPDGFRVMKPTSTVLRDGDRWEIYAPCGSGGIVHEDDVTDWVVRKLLDAIAAAPAAPAADAGLVEALELAANRLDRLAMEHDEFWRGYATMWVREARAALADHRAKGVV